MPHLRISIEQAALEIAATLVESATAQALWAALPLECPAQTWGAEVYFTVPVECPAEDPRATVAPGAIGYWPPGSAVCLFFGQQPVSPVNLIGAIEGDPGVLGSVREGQIVHLEAIED